MRLRSIVNTVLLARSSVIFPTETHAKGARIYKSGPIQITADGAYVWVTIQADHQLKPVVSLNPKLTIIRRGEPNPDDDGEIGLADGIRILNVLFLGTSFIPSPGHRDYGEDLSPENPDLPACDYHAC